MADKDKDKDNVDVSGVKVYPSNAMREPITYERAEAFETDNKGNLSVDSYKDGVMGIAVWAAGEWQRAEIIYTIKEETA